MDTKNRKILIDSKYTKIKHYLLYLLKLCFFIIISLSHFNRTGCLQNLIFYEIVSNPPKKIELLRRKLFCDELKNCGGISLVGHLRRAIFGLLIGVSRVAHRIISKHFAIRFSSTLKGLLLTKSRVKAHFITYI